MVLFCNWVDLWQLHYKFDVVQCLDWASYQILLLTMLSSSHIPSLSSRRCTEVYKVEVLCIWDYILCLVNQKEKGHKKTTIHVIRLFLNLNRLWPRESNFVYLSLLWCITRDCMIFLYGAMFDFAHWKWNLVVEHSPFASFIHCQWIVAQEIHRKDCTILGTIEPIFLKSIFRFPKPKILWKFKNWL